MGIQRFLDGNGKSTQAYTGTAGVPQCSIIGPTLFLLYINDLPDDVICNIAIYADNATLYLSVIRHLILNLACKTLWTRTGSDLLISMLEKLSWFCLTGLITLVLFM